MSHTKTSRDSGPTHFRSQRTLDLVCPDWGKDLTVGHRSDLVLQWRLDGAVVTVGGAYSRDISEDSQISDGSFFATAHSLICAESPNGPAFPVE